MNDKHNGHDGHDHSGHDHSHDKQAAAPAVLNAGVHGERVTILAVNGMDCADEVKVLNETLGPLDGVRSVEANLMAAKITVTHNEGITPEKLIAAIKPTGMEAQVAQRGQKFGSGANAQRQRAIAVGVSGALTGLGLILQWTHAGPDALRIAIFVGAIIAGGWFILPKALAALRRFSFDMNLLMTVAVAGAAIIGEWSEGAAVTFLFGLSELLEAFSVQRARRAIESLLELSPESALGAARRCVCRGAGGPGESGRNCRREKRLARAARRHGDNWHVRGEPSADHRRVDAGGKEAGRSGLRRHHQWRGFVGSEGHESRGRHDARAHHPARGTGAVGESAG